MITLLAATVVISAAAIAIVPKSFGQNQAPAAAAQTADQVFRNIQIFKGVSVPEFRSAMDFMAAALGVNCDYCHVSSFDSDEKPSKITARAMIQMTRDLNKTGFSGYDVVNCYTCHRGNIQPASVPGATGPESGNADSPPSPQIALPSIEAVLQKYTHAVGGQQAIDNCQTLIAEGSRTTETGAQLKVDEPFEVLEKPASDKYMVITSSPAGPAYRGFSGASGKLVTEKGSTVLDKNELSQLKENEEFCQYLRLKDTYPRMAVLSQETVRGRKAYLVGAAASDGQRVKLYFDVSAGLLLRKEVPRKTILGTLLQTTDFEDYRGVAGLMLPFKITYTEPPRKIIEHFTRIQINKPSKEPGFDQLGR